MWAGEDNGSDVNWNQAKGYCGNLHLGGYSNWRLATIDELAGNYDATQNVNDCHVKGGIKFHDSCWSWSSSVGLTSDEAWHFHFGYGGRDSNFLDVSIGSRVLCVRRP